MCSILTYRVLWLEGLKQIEDQNIKEKVSETDSTHFMKIYHLSSEYANTIFTAMKYYNIGVSGVSDVYPFIIYKEVGVGQRDVKLLFVRQNEEASNIKPVYSM